MTQPISVTPPSALPPQGTLKMSFRRSAVQTAQEVNLVAQHRFQIQGKWYRAWASTNGGETLQAATSDWETLKKNLFQKVFQQQGPKEEVVFNLEKGELTSKTKAGNPFLTTSLNLQGASEITEQKAAFEAFAAKTVAVKGKHTRAVPSPEKAKDQQRIERSKAGRSTIKELRKENYQLSPECLAYSLEFLHENARGLRPILPPFEESLILEGLWQQNVWQTEIVDDEKASINDSALISHCQLPKDLKEPVYLPLRSGHHFMGLLVKDKKVYYYDSKGNPLGLFSAAKEQIDIFCKKNDLTLSDVEYNPKEEGVIPHQSSSGDNHCPIYQMLWSGYLAKTKFAEGTLFSQKAYRGFARTFRAFLANQIEKSLNPKRRPQITVL